MHICDIICSRKRWIFLTTFLIVGILATTGYVAYLTFFKPMTKEAILHKFGNVFYTERQIEIFRQSEHIDRVKGNNSEKYRKTCSFSCSQSYIGTARQPPYSTVDINTGSGGGTGRIGHHQRNQNRGGNSVDRSNTTTDNNGTVDNSDDVMTATSGGNVSVTNGTTNNNNTTPGLGRVRGDGQTGHERYHGCCVSRTRVVVPSQLTTHDGRSVRAVQFKGRNQIYLEDDCRQLDGCTGCTCFRETRYMVAVVVDDDGGDNHGNGQDSMDQARYVDYRLETVSVPGCCKCLNDDGV